jgi:hypothetical protein
MMKTLNELTLADVRLDLEEGRFVIFFRSRETLPEDSLGWHNRLTSNLLFEEEISLLKLDQRAAAFLAMVKAEYGNGGAR